MLVVHNTFVIERNYPKPAAAVFSALSDPAKMRRWYTAGDPADIIDFQSDFRVGGQEINAYRLNAASPFPGAAIVHTGRYLDIVPDKRIVSASSMSFAGNRVSASLITFELVASDSATTLIFTHQGAFFEGADGTVMREAGWRILLDKLFHAL